MGFTATERYGGQTRYRDEDDPRAVAQALLAQLRIEEELEPDDEHTDVSISFEDWVISVKVSGLVTLMDLSWIAGKPSDHPRNAKYMSEDLYLRDVRDETLIDLMANLARGNMRRVREADWKNREDLPPFERDFYRQ